MLRRDLLRTTALTALATPLVACARAGPMPTAVITGGAPTTPPEDAVNYYKSEVPPDVLATLVGDERALAVDLYRAISKQVGNLFLSPYGIYVALSMPYVGARGQTATQMSRGWHLSLPLVENSLLYAVESLGLELEGRGLLFDKQSRQNILRLKTANLLYGQTNYEFTYEYLITVAKQYGVSLPTLDQGKFPTLDFAAAPDRSRQTIDAWAKDQTAGRIPDLLSMGTIDRTTRLVLANATYLGIPWKSPFSPTSTKTMPFHLLDGITVGVPTMSATLTVPYAKGHGYQVIEVPCDGDGLGLVIFLPDAGMFAQFEQGLTVAKLKDVLAALSPKQVALSLPKLKLAPRLDLVAPLKGLGVTDAFDASKSDFTGMTDRRELSIGDVVHKTTISLDERGTEATAATGVVMGSPAAPKVETEPTAAPQPTAVQQVDATVAVDRPFIFLIRDDKTDAVVYLGRVTNPNA